MQNYRLKLQSPVSTTFRCQKAANSLDIDTEKKAIHEFSVDADLTKDFNIGLIVGASGSGKTTLAKHIYGDNCFNFVVDESLPVIDQFPESMSYDECATMLSGIGLTSVPCWIRPIYTLSNGQKARANAALQMASGGDFIVDEWTSVVDRTAAKAMSHCLQKFARKSGRRVVVLSCHYDVIDWLNPCWIIDCNKQEYVDRRLLWREYNRQEQLQFEIRSVGKETWRYFSRYHYLSQKLPGGHIETYGIFHDQNQIGFQCFANYTPDVAGKKRIMHFNRTVIHPDYIGFGLGIKLINATCADMAKKGYKIMAKFSSTPVKKALDKNSDLWRLLSVKRDTATSDLMSKRNKSLRRHIKTFSYVYLPSIT